MLEPPINTARKALTKVLVEDAITIATTTMSIDKSAILILDKAKLMASTSAMPDTAASK